MAPSQIYKRAFPCEDIDKYRPGGYHPVSIGDSLHNSRYKILNKLGYGSSATVWLARDEVAKQNVAFKIFTSESSCTEASMLTTISSMRDGSHPGRSSIIQILGSFAVHGPNGTHDCLVLELLGPCLSTLCTKACADGRLPPLVGKSVALQVLRGLDLLAKNKICHRDLRMQNIAVCIPGLASLNEDEVLELYGQPKTAAITYLDKARHGEHLGISVPPHIVDDAYPNKATLSKLVTTDLKIKIIDFGNAFVDDHPPVTVKTPARLRAPEIHFHQKLDHRIDLWSMGCLLFQLAAKETPFDGDSYDNARIIAQILHYIPGATLTPAQRKKWLAMQPPPPQSVEGPDGKSYTRLRGLVGHLYYESWIVEPSLDFDDIVEIARLCEKLLKMEPGDRASAAEMLEEAWFHSE